MKIIINDGSREKPIVIRLPLILAANPVGSAIVAKSSDEISFWQAQALMRALRKAKKHLDGIPLVEVISEDGAEVTVYL